MNDATKVGTVAITVTGDTTYDKGVEYLVSAVNVTNTVGTKTIPISINATASGTLGTSDEDYFDNRDTATSHIYKVLAKDTISNNDQLMVGYIANNATGINGTITIKAYLDENKIGISDTYDGTESDSMGTTNEWAAGRTVFTTTEWNSLQGTGISFQIRVEANEGTWVEEPPRTVNSMERFPANISDVKQNIREVYFNKMNSDTMQSRYDAATYKADLTYNNEGKVLAWLEEDKLYIASDGNTYLNNVDGLFSGWSNVEKIEFNNVDTSRVISMTGMFYNCSSLTNLDLSKFDTANVTSMTGMFQGCSSLANIDLSNFDTLYVVNMQNMFCDCGNITTLDLSSFNTSNLSNDGMAYMFKNCSALTKIYVSNRWDSSNQYNNMPIFTDNNNLIGGNGTLFNGSKIDKNVAIIDTADNPGYLTYKEFKVNNSINAMKNFKDSTFSSIKSSIKKIMFINIKQQDIDKRYSAATIKEDITLSDEGNVKAWVNGTTLYVASPGETYFPEDCSWLFQEFTNVQIIYFENINTSRVTNMQYMFYYNDKLCSIDISMFDTSNVTDMSGMFYYCESIESIDLSGKGSEKLLNIQQIFGRCNNLKYVNMSDFTYNGTSLNELFYYHENLEIVDFTNIKLNNVTNMTSIFSNCTNLKTIFVSNTWDVNNVTSSSSMFSNCTSLKGGGTPQTTYDSTHTDKEYARIDGGANSATPGYLTLKTN